MMKTTILTVCTTLFAACIFGQDVIIKKSGDDIEAKILEVTETHLKYKEYSFQDGPTRNLNLSEVLMVIYENGRREKFADHRESSTGANSGSSVSNNDNQASNYFIEEEVSNKKQGREANDTQPGNFFSMGFGYGNSYGGLGLRLQYVTAGPTRIGFHAGAGYFSTSFGASSLFVSAGIQVYFWEDLYLNAQYGAFGIERNSWSFSNGQSTSFRSEDRTLTGPSFLIGYDWFWTENFGGNLGVGLSFDTGGNTGSHFALDSGFFIKF